MTTNNARKHRCPACRSTDPAEASYQRAFHPRGRAVVVTLLSSRCTACGAEFTKAAQHDENLVRLKARKAEYDGLLLGEEIAVLRRRYGITQQQAAKIFGKGKIAFSRYENETSYPDDSTTKLLKLAIQKPDVVKSLADDAGVTLPLWEARCADERGAKVRVMSDVSVADPAAQRWAQKELLASGKRTTSDTLSFPIASRWNAEMVNSPANDDRFGSSEATFA